MISIIIPAFDQHSMTDDCISAIACNTKDYEIILIDNGSTPAFLPQIDMPFTIIRNETNLGFPVAVNQGIEAAKGDTIVLLNNDVIVTPGWLGRMRRDLDKYAIVGPMTGYCAGLQHVNVPVYNDENELNEVALSFSEQHSGKSLEVNWVIGFCMMFKKSIWEEIGPFDESLWPCSGEELDFCLTARSRGYKVGITQDVYLHHHGSVTFKAIGNDDDYVEWCKRNEDRVAKKWGKDFWFKQLTELETKPGVRLNMGSGPFPLKGGFVNIDQFASVNPDVIADVTAVPYELGTIDEIYAGHVLEHFRYEDGMRALRYWFALLKPGGEIRICVPDYDFLVKEYAEAPTPEKLKVFNDTYIYSGIQPSPHQYAYSAALLKQVMEEAGFIKLERMPVDHPYFPEAVKWQCGYEGVKP
jgi:GT2 family glycosyltransferase/predicted SAM-dependent methyltransferase